MDKQYQSTSQDWKNNKKKNKTHMSHQFIPHQQKTEHPTGDVCKVILDIKYIILTCSKYLEVRTKIVFTNNIFNSS